MNKILNCLLVLSLLGLASERALAGAFEDCLVQGITNAGAGVTAEAVREQCKSQSGAMTSTAVSGGKYADSAAEQRFTAEHDTENRDFVISTYKPLYVIYTHNSKFDSSFYEGIDPKFDGLKKDEMKYQVSMKAPLWQNMFGSNNDLYAAYTQTSWWQLFAKSHEVSAPFRETNYEPEIFIRHYSGRDIPFGGKLTALDFGFVHQSNGRSEPISRSWNRVMGKVILDYGSLAFLGRLWWRIPESDRSDDNPGMHKYLGYGDIMASWAPNKNTVSLMVRPGTEKAGMELTWSYPITKNLRVFSQWYYGYGESMIDYNNKVNRFGIGISLNDWLIRPH